MKNIKVSIVIPVYNASKYLSKCLDSVINQSYRDIEIILVDDGSTDNSGKICDDYADNDKRIAVLHGKNSGVSTARNNGIKSSTGEYVTFVDSDDIIHPDYIKKLVNNLNDDVLPVCQIENFYDEVIFLDNEKEKIKLDKSHFIELCKWTLLNTPCCKLYNLDIIRKNKILFDAKLSLGEDLLFNFDYLNYIDKITIVNQKLYYYRRSENDTLSTAYNPEMMAIQLLLFDKYTEFFEKTSMDIEMSTLFDSYRFSTLMAIIENEFKNKDISFIKRYFNARNILKNNRMQEAINKIKHFNKKLLYFLISHKMILSYKVINKIKSII